MAPSSSPNTLVEEVEEGGSAPGKTATENWESASTMATVIITPALLLERMGLEAMEVAASILSQRAAAASAGPPGFRPP